MQIETKITFITSRNMKIEMYYQGILCYLQQILPDSRGTAFFGGLCKGILITQLKTNSSEKMNKNNSGHRSKQI